MTKEEIIRRYEPYPNKAEVNIIGIMMEEYAQQTAKSQSILFALDSMDRLGLFKTPKEKEDYKGVLERQYNLFIEQTGGK